MTAIPAAKSQAATVTATAASAFGRPASVPCLAPSASFHVGPNPQARSDSGGTVSTTAPDGMTSFESAFNNLLVSTFRSIERYEESVLREQSGMNITIAEAHFIEAVARAQRDNPEGVTVTLAAETLGVSPPTATAAVNRLVAKGLIEKTRGKKDARVVNLSLTREGEKAYRLHAVFHQQLAHALLHDLSAQECDALVSGIRKVQAFFSTSTDQAGAGQTQTHQEV